MHRKIRFSKKRGTYGGRPLPGKASTPPSPAPGRGGSHPLLLLFFTFAKIGAFTFGGGYAMIPLIEREAVEKRKFLTSDELLQLLALSEATPGPFAVNAATFIGSRTAGFPGALLATLGVVLPSFCILLLLSLFWDSFSSLAPVRRAFLGIRAAVPALLLKALWSTFGKCKKNFFTLLLLLLSFLLTLFDLLPLFLLPLGFGLFGVLVSFFGGRNRSDKF